MPLHIRCNSMAQFVHVNKVQPCEQTRQAMQALKGTLQNVAHHSSAAACLAECGTAGPCALPSPAAPAFLGEVGGEAGVPPASCSTCTDRGPAGRLRTIDLLGYDFSRFYVLRANGPREQAASRFC